MTDTRQPLFKEQPLMGSNGRYCTKEQHHDERVDEENMRLRLERDRYFRITMALERDNERLTRELMVLKSKLEG